MTQDEVKNLGCSLITHGDEKIDAFMKGYQAAAQSSVVPPLLSDTKLGETAGIDFGDPSWHQQLSKARDIEQLVRQQFGVKP